MTKNSFTNGNGEPVEREWVIQELYNFRDFKTAAKEISVEWTTHYLHKQIQMNRVDLSKVLVQYDENLKLHYPVTKGKTYYMHVDEIKRIKEDVLPTIKKVKRKHPICPYCRQDLILCLREPCKERIQVKIDEKISRQK